MLHHCHPTIGTKPPPSTLTFDKKNDFRKPHHNQQITKRAPSPRVVHKRKYQKDWKKKEEENRTTAVVVAAPPNLCIVSSFLSESE
jgi:hypothetical protein